MVAEHSTNPLITLSDTLLGYRARPVLRADSLQLAASRCLGIFGPNGVGKTTLVRSAIGLLPPLSGAIRRAPDLRVGYVPQHRSIEMHWPMTGFDAAAMAISAGRWFGWLGAAGARIRQSLVDLDLLPLANKPFATLSGGQQQRLMLAGVLADRPDLLVLDEPTDGLDLASRRSFLDTLRQRLAQGLSILLISHEVEDLLDVAHEIAWLHPAADESLPATVELIAPEDLSKRLSRVRLTAS